MSATVYVKDKGGKTLRFKEMDGRRYPYYLDDTLRHATEMEARTDDILLITYPKSGTHWVFQIIRYLLAGKTHLPIIEKTISMLERVDRDVVNGLPVDIPRNLNSHHPADTLSPDFLRKKSKIIYVTRNPRDVVTSYFNHHSQLALYEYEGVWEDYFPLFLEGALDFHSWFEHTKGWEKCIKDHPDNPFLVLSYEGLKQEPLANIKKIADFIDVEHNEEFLEEVVEKTGFESMSKARQAGEEKARAAIFYRKGQVGDWKNHFTVAQSEIFNGIFEKEMAGTNAYKLYSHTVET